MRSLFSIAAFLLALSLVGQAEAQQCWNRGAILQDVREIRQEARRFQQIVRQLTGYAHLTDDVRRLDRQARQLERLVQSGASCRRLHREFQDVERSFRQVDRQVTLSQRGRRDRRIQREWYRVERAVYAARNSLNPWRGGYGYGDGAGFRFGWQF